MLAAASRMKTERGWLSSKNEPWMQLSMCSHGNNMQVKGSLYLDGLNAVQDPLRDAQANNVLFEAGVGLDGHHSGDDGTGDADGPTGLDPVQKQWDIEEELGDNEVCTSVDLFLQEPQVLLHGGRLGVLFWVACHADAKVVAVGLADVADQV